MAKITPEMEALLNYAEERSFCLYQTELPEKEEFEGWEDMLWDAGELRRALKDYPDQPGAGRDYPGHSYPDTDINDHKIWRIVDPKHVLSVFETRARLALEEARSQEEHASYFRRLWIDRTEAPVWKCQDGGLG